MYSLNNKRAFYLALLSGLFSLSSTGALSREELSAMHILEICKISNSENLPKIIADRCQVLNNYFEAHDKSAEKPHVGISVIHFAMTLGWSGERIQTEYALLADYLDTFSN